MDAVYNWIKGIAFYLIIVLAIQNVLPDNKYKKYIKMFTGMILVLLIISPITNLFNYTDKIANVYQSKLVEQEVNQMKNQLTGMEDSIVDASISQYKEYVKQQINLFVEEEGYQLAQFSCEVNENVEISNISLVISKESTNQSNINIDKITIDSDNKNISEIENSSLNKIKKSIVDFYNISESNINISIR